MPNHQPERGGEEEMLTITNQGGEGEDVNDDQPGRREGELCLQNFKVVSRNRANLDQYKNRSTRYLALTSIKVNQPPTAATPTPPPRTLSLCQ